MFDVVDGFGEIEKETIHFNQHFTPKEIISELKSENQQNKDHFPILNYKLNLINSINDSVFKLNHP